MPRIILRYSKNIARTYMINFYKKIIRYQYFSHKFAAKIPRFCRNFRRQHDDVTDDKRERERERERSGKKEWISERWAEAEFECAAEKIRGFSWQGDW